MAINIEERTLIIDCLKFCSGTLQSKIESMDQLISEAEVTALEARIDKIDNLIFKIEN